MITRVAALASFVVAISSTAFAQQQGLFGGASPTGGAGTTAAGGAGGTGVGAGGGGATAGAAFEQGGPQISTELGSLSQTAGQTGFIGRGADGAAFIGSNAATAGQAGQGNTPNFRPGGQGGGNANQGRGQQQGGGVRTISRPVVRMAFDFPAPPPPVVDRVVQTRIVAISARRPELEGVQVTVDPAGVAFVSGRVPTPSAAKLALAMIRLEPGVRRVESDLIVE